VSRIIGFKSQEFMEKKISSKPEDGIFHWMA